MPLEKLARVPPPHPFQVKMVSSPNVPTDNLDSQGSILPSYSKELEEFCQFSVADGVNAIVYFGFIVSRFAHDQIAHVRYIKILTRLRGFRVKIANFS